MRVLMTTDSVGGVWQYSLALARGLAEQWASEVLLVCFGEPDRRDLAGAIPVPGVSLLPVDLKLEWMPDSADDVQKAKDLLLRQAKVWRPDVLHFNQYCLGQVDSYVPKVVVGHSDVVSWTAWHRWQGEIDLDRIEDDPDLRRHRDDVALGLAGATAVVAPSKFMAQVLDEVYGCPAEMIHNGLWPDVYRPEPKEEVAVVAGRLWDEAKQVATAVEAVSGLPIQLRLIGPTVGPSGEQARLPEAPNVEYLGRLSWDTARVAMARARYYLACSSYEPFGLAALEAAFTGCALVTNDTPFYRDIWSDSALYYGRNDPDDLAAKLSGLLQNPWKAEKLGKAAHARAMERYTAQRMTKDYFRLYRSLT